MSLLRKLIPTPVLSIALLLVWIALARSTSFGHLLIGTILAFVVPLVVSGLGLANVRLKRPGVIVRFVSIVLWDVVKSNLVVARGVLGWGSRRPDSRFVVVPLELRDPVGLAVLAMVTTIVPGTVWSELAIDRSSFLLHVWDVDEERAFVARFKARYEQPLREIFE